STGVLVARTRVAPMSMASSIRDEVLAIDKEQPVFDIKTMADVELGSVFFLQVCSQWLGAFAGLALILAAVGIYGVMSYSVSQRTREIGIRVALGARSSSVLGLVIGQGLRLTLVGIGVGSVGSFLLSWVLSSFVYGVKTAEFLTFGGAALVLMVVSLLACYIPAKRAMKVDPMVALRYE
ncbi:MAG TPA: FtsX-like permease family protein, partial [Blastocatellia bacterium]|nr:FtsX-like permease family protein [Blastocatellia bacterium]